MNDYAGKIAFITGGARGFGQAFGREIGRTGTVVLADIDGGAARQAAEGLTDSGCQAVGIECDVSDPVQVERAVADAVGRFGGIDILVNNAGLHLTKYNRPFSVQPREDIRRLFDVNVNGVMNCSLACRESMRSRGGGVIVNISSMASYSSVTPYGVTKLAVRGLTVAFATEFAPDNIRCNGIAPGLMATENAIADLPRDLVDSIVNDRQLIHRQGEVDDIVRALAFLCSDDSSFITGETLKVTGGTPLWI